MWILIHKREEGGPDTGETHEDNHNRWQKNKGRECKATRRVAFNTSSQVLAEMSFCFPLCETKDTIKIIKQSAPESGNVPSSC